MSSTSDGRVTRAAIHHRSVVGRAWATAAAVVGLALVSFAWSREFLDTGFFADDLNHVVTATRFDAIELLTSPAAMRAVSHAHLTPLLGLSTSTGMVRMPAFFCTAVLSIGISFFLSG